MKECVIRCSSLGKIMTEPKLKSETLSVGAKTHIREMAREAIFGVYRHVTSRAMEKGLRCEQASIDLYNSVNFTSHVKNTERRIHETLLTGECDVAAADEIIDVKTSWSIDTFPICEVDCVDAIYEWQLRGYLLLWDRPRARVAYCLVDTPDDLIGYEQRESHIVSHLPEHHRVTTWAIERDAEKEARIIDKCKAAQAYYADVIAEFDRTHQS